MSKKIVIKGKKTFDKLNDKKPVRDVKWSDNKTLLNEKEQITILNKLFLENNYEGDTFVKKEVERKIRSYKYQDVKKNVYDSTQFISYDEVMEKLVISKLKCNYCRKNCLLMYNNVREMRQWTLDRIDNSDGHTNKNTVICCLDCNLKRGTLNDKKFEFTKQLKITKKY